MSDMQRPQQTDSGISVGGSNQSADHGLNATVNLSRKGMGPSSRVASAQKPSVAQVNQLPRAAATQTGVTCPAEGCNAEFEIDPSLYGEVGQCEQCNTVFYIEPPGSTKAPQSPAQAPGAAAPNQQPSPSVPDPMTTVEMSRGPRPGRNMNPAPPPPPPQKPPAAPPQRTTSSGIQADKASSAKDYGLTATVTLSRSGMGMMQKKKQQKQQQMPATNQMRFSVARGNEVACPQCRTMFPITPEVYGAIAECSECECEFQIRAPSGAGAPPAAAPPAQQQAPAQQQPPAPQPPAPQQQKPAPSSGAPKPSKPRPSGGRNRRPKARRRTRSSTRNQAADAEAAPSKKGSGNAIVIALVVVIALLIGVIIVGGIILAG